MKRGDKFYRFSGLRSFLGIDYIHQMQMTGNTKTVWKNSNEIVSV